jgi:hypothetical protein
MGVVVIGDDGVAEPVANGDAEITATLEGLPSDPATVTVSLGLICNSIDIEGAATVAAGRTIDIKVWCYTDAAGTVNVTTNVVWDPSNDHAAVASDGTVTGQTEGTTVLTATFNNPNGTEETTNHTIAVTPGVLERIEVSPPYPDAIYVDDNLQFSAACFYSDRDDIPCTDSVSWHVDPLSGVLSMSGGTVTGTGSGTAHVTASSDTVTSNSVELTVLVSELYSIEITNGASSVGIGETLLLQAVCHETDGSDYPCTSDVSWRSSNQVVAIIGDPGEVKGRAIGSTNIFAESGSGDVSSDPLALEVVPPTGCDDDIAFDGAMEGVIRDEIQQSTGAISYSNLQSIDYLVFEDMALSNLAGLQCVTSLLGVTFQNVTGIDDFSALSSLVSLEDLIFRNTGIGNLDLEMVGELAKIEYMVFRDTTLTSLDGLEGGVPLLRVLDVVNCGLVDISAVAGMDNLDVLDITNNNVSDITPLGDNTGLGEGDKLHMRENSYSCDSPVMTDLYSRGFSIFATECND